MADVLWPNVTQTGSYAPITVPGAYHTSHELLDPTSAPPAVHSTDGTTTSTNGPIPMVEIEITDYSYCVFRNGPIPMVEIEITDYSWYCIGYNISIYGLPIVIFLGLIGNTLSLVVATRPRNRRLPYGIYVAALAMADTVMLLGCQLQGWTMHYFMPEKMSATQCLGIVYITGAVGNFEAWTISALALERFLCVCYPSSSKKYRTRELTIKILFTILMICLLKNIHFFFITDFYYDHYSQIVVCATGYFSGSSKNIALEIFEILFNSVIPFMCILIFNARVIYRLHTQERFRRATRSNSLNQSGMRRERADSEESLVVKTNGITVMLITVALTFVMLTLPIFIFRAVSTYGISSTPLTQARYIFFDSLFSLLFATNFAVNFYLYCLTGTSFRNDLKELFCVKRGIHV